MSMSYNPCNQRSRDGRERRGITLIMAVLIISGILLASVGMVNSVLTELALSGELSDSFRAAYAADEGLERLYYYDLVLDFAGVPGAGADCADQNLFCRYDPPPIQSEGACIELDLWRSAGSSGNTIIRGVGRYPLSSGCVNEVRMVHRSFTEDYQKY